MFSVTLINLLFLLYGPEITHCADLSSSEPELQPIEPCKSAKPPNNGTVNIWGNKMLVEFMCDEGLFPVGSTFGSCNTTSKKWSVKPPLCVSSACDHPANISNGQLYFDHSGGIVIAVCKRGYRLTGDRERYCDGYTWRGVSPICREIYPSRSERRQARNNITANSTQVKPAEILEKHILEADNTCYQEFRDPPEVKNATVEIIYKFNKVRRQWILIANYTCQSGFIFNDTSSSYLYCQNYDWVGKATPACVNTVTRVIDPCETKNGGCEHTCVSHGKGTFRCECRSGFILGPSRKQCIDIDECRFDNGGCEQNCVNFIGSFFCKCNKGYVSEGFQCLDIDECSSQRQHQCPGECINVPGTYTCNCSMPGFTEARQKTTCSDYNECSDNNGGCKEVCINTVGSYKCGCKRKGYSLSRDAIKCEDIDECQTDNGKCEDVCVNTAGSYKCLCREENAVLHEDGYSCISCDRYSFYDGNKGCSPCPLNSVVNESVAIASNIDDCVCHMGYYRGNNSEGDCIDIDECSSNYTNDCIETCINTPGSYRCDCFLGHALVGYNKCAPCPENFFRDENSTECVSCPVNSVTQGRGQISIDDCKCVEGHGKATFENDCLEV